MKAAQGESVNVTPLIDVVMCLIIFFMVCGRLAQAVVAGGNVTVPIASLGQPLPEQRTRLVISLEAPASAGGAPTLLINGKPEDYTAVFSGRTETGRGGPLAPYTKGDKDIKVIVRADQAVQYQYIAPVLVAAATADLRSVHFSTQKPKS